MLAIDAESTRAGRDGAARRGAIAPVDGRGVGGRRRVAVTVREGGHRAREGQALGGREVLTGEVDAGQPPFFQRLQARLPGQDSPRGASADPENPLEQLLPGRTEHGVTLGVRVYILLGGLTAQATRWKPNTWLTVVS